LLDSYTQHSKPVLAMEGSMGFVELGIIVLEDLVVGMALGMVCTNLSVRI
jgi:hypothetical protein